MKQLINTKTTEKWLRIGQIGKVSVKINKKKPKRFKQNLKVLMKTNLAQDCKHLYIASIHLFCNKKWQVLHSQG